MRPFYIYSFILSLQNLGVLSLWYAPISTTAV